VRDLLAMIQAALAAFLGVDPSTVGSWEQGIHLPSPLAYRLRSELEAAPDPLAQAARTMSRHELTCLSRDAADQHSISVGEGVSRPSGL
jgi:DNA-binding XRE family transcriptional regulator